MDDYLECARLCEEQGFARQAGLLRSVAAGERSAFVVAGSEKCYYVEHGPHDGGVTHAVFLDRAKADRESDRRNVRAFRERNIFEGCTYEPSGPIYLEEVSDLTAWELSEQIGDILEQPFEIPQEAPVTLPIFPDSATDDQIRRIMGLFTIRYFYVAEAVLAG